MSLTTLRHALIDQQWAEAQAIFESESLDLNQPDGRLTLLLWAVDKRHVEMMKWLVEHGADLNQIGGPQGETPLGAAVRIGVLEAVDWLIAAGADLERADDQGATPLMRALQHGSKSTLLTRRLLKAGANPNAQTARDGDTVLMLALNDGRRDLLPDLAAAGADPELANKEGRTPLHVVVKEHRLDLLKTFLHCFPNVDLDRATKTGLTALSQSQAPAITMELLRRGGNPAVRSINPFDEGRTPLMHLLKHAQGGEEIALALRLGAPVQDQDFKGMTNLGYAIEAGNINGMELLYRQGLPTDSPASREGLSPYHLAVRLTQAGLKATREQEQALAKGRKPSKKAPISEVLIDQAMRAWTVLDSLHVPVDVACNKGPGQLPLASPLVEALKQSQDILVAQWLIEAGASAATQGPNGRTPAHGLAALDADLSVTLLHQEVVLAMSAKARQEERDPPFNDEELTELTRREDRARVLRDESRLRFEDWFGLLNAAGLDLSRPDNRGWNALEMAIREGGAQLAVAAVQSGMDPNAAMSDGSDAFTLALKSGKPLVLLGLIEAAQANGQTWTPQVCDWVLESPEDYPQRTHFLEALRVLTLRPEWATWLSQTDDQGNTPLLLASATGQDDLVELFLDSGLASQVNQANQLGETPLLHAAAQKEAGILRRLLAHGADRQTRAHSGIAAASLVEQETYLKEAWAEPNNRSPDEDAARLKHLRTVLERGEVIVALARRLGNAPLPTSGPAPQVTLAIAMDAWKQGQPEGQLDRMALLLEQPLEDFGMQVDPPQTSTNPTTSSKGNGRRPRP